MEVKDGDTTRDVVFVCSVTASGYQLVRNEKYPENVDDFRKSFRILESMKLDIFLVARVTSSVSPRSERSSQRNLRRIRF